MDDNIKIRSQDAAGEVAENPTPSTAAQRGRYQFPLIEIARTVAQLAAQRDTMTVQQLQAVPCPLENHSALVLAARGACLERGYLADGSAPRFGTGDRREDPLAALLQQPGIEFTGYYDIDECYGQTILDFVRARLENNPDDLKAGDVFTVSACWIQNQDWRVLQSGNPVEVERVTPPVLELEVVASQAAASIKELAKAMADDWILADEQQPHNGQKVWITSLTEYSNAPPDYGVLESVFEHGIFRSPCGQMYAWPKHWKPRVKPTPPPLQDEKGGA